MGKKKTAKKSHSRKQLYFYDSYCRDAMPIFLPNNETFFWAALVSEIKLSKKNEKLDGKCVTSCPRLGRVPAGTVLDLAYGDPIVLKNCTVITYDKKNTPTEVSEEYDGRTCMTLLYKGKRIWVAKFQICRLKDVLKKRK